MREIHHYSNMQLLRSAEMFMMERINGSATLLSCSILYPITMLCIPIQSNKP
jgi:hypothetical protein